MLGTQRSANALPRASLPPPPLTPQTSQGSPPPTFPILPEIWIKNHGSKVSALPEFTPPTQQNRSRRPGAPLSVLGPGAPYSSRNLNFQTLDVSALTYGVYFSLRTSTDIRTTPSRPFFLRNQTLRIWGLQAL